MTTALSQVVTSWADVLTAVSRHPDASCPDDLIAAAIRTAADILPATAGPPPDTDQR